MGQQGSGGGGSSSLSTNDRYSPNTGSVVPLKSGEIVYQQKVGFSPMEALQIFEELTPFEKTELNSYDVIYTIGSHRVNGLRQVASKDGFYSVTIGE